MSVNYVMKYLQLIFSFNRYENEVHSICQLSTYIWPSNVGNREMNKLYEGLIQ